MRQKIKEPPKSRLPRPPLNSEETFVENIIKDAESKMGDDQVRRGYYWNIKKESPNPTNPNAVSYPYIGKLTKIKDVYQELSDLFLPKFGPGVYRLECHDTDGDRIRAVKPIDVPIGIPAPRDKQSDNRIVPTESDRQPQRHPNDAIGDDPTLRKKRIEVESKDLEIELIKKEQELKKVQGGDDMDANAQIVSEMRTDKKISDMGNSITNSVNTTIAGVIAKMDQNFQQMLNTLKPSNNGELTELKNEIRELKSKGEQTSATTLIIKSMEQMNSQNLEHMKSMAEKQNADTQRQHELTMKMMDKDSGNKGLGFQQFIEAFNKGMDIALEKESLKIDKINAEAGTGETEQPWYEKLFTMISGTLQELAKDGTLQQMMTKSSEPQPKLLVPPEQMKTISQSITANVIAKVKSGEIKIPGVVLNPPATAGTKSESPPAEKNPPKEPTPPVEGSVDPEQIKKNIVNAILTNILLEIDIRPKVIQWTSPAFDNLPEDVLNDIVNAKTSLEVIGIISKYADKQNLDALGAKLKDAKNLAWLMRGIRELKEMAAEENTSEEVKS